MDKQDKEYPLKLWQYMRCKQTCANRAQRRERSCTYCFPDKPDCIYWLALTEYYDIESEVETQ